MEDYCWLRGVSLTISRDGGCSLVGEGRGEFDDKKGWRMTAGPAGVEEGCEWAASA